MDSQQITLSAHTPLSGQKHANLLAVTIHRQSRPYENNNNDDEVGFVCTHTCYGPLTLCVYVRECVCACVCVCVCVRACVCVCVSLSLIDRGSPGCVEILGPQGSR